MASRGITLALLTTVGTLIGAGIGAAQTAPEPAVTRRVVISFADRKLALIENDAVVLVLPVAIGAPETPSPVGTFEIVTRLSRPTYYGRRQVIEPGPSNPLGTRWIGLSAKGYGLHGTDNPRSIGRAKSHGCIRLRNADVEKLFARVRVGDVVELRATRTPDLDRLFGASTDGTAVVAGGASREMTGLKPGTTRRGSPGFGGAGL